MAKMLFREPNLSRWVGGRPAHNGVQVLKGDHAVNATVVIHTVTAGKTLFLVEWMIGLNAVGAGSSYLEITDATPTRIRMLSMIFCAAATPHPSAQGTAYPPMEIPAGYKIRVVSNGAAIDVYAGIFGWEE